MKKSDLLGRIQMHYSREDSLLSIQRTVDRSISDRLLLMSKALKHLLEQFEPNNYKLELSINKKDMTYSGKVKISGKKIGRPTKRITLHQKGLKITKAALTSHSKQGDKSHEVARINLHNKFDEVRIHTEAQIYPGNVTLDLDFNGIITKQMDGIYPCTFTDEGVTKQLIATQFESHHAREVFPCIDEPAAKATFDLKLSTDIDEAVISNTPIKKQTQSKKVQSTWFETTPIMSTYLLAFVVGDMKHIEKSTKHGTKVRIYATPPNIEHTKFALDFAVNCLEFYENYFDIPYPLEKCDHIALPDFASGAMENWGCITYREQALLIDEVHSPLSMKQRVATVIAHELAHQWFGNLVTMRWWTDLWLNEGFASWIEFLAVDHIFPEWKMWTQLLVDEQQTALRLDALEHTHPVEVAINHPDEIRSIFDTISYSKGASVIHMLHNYLGAEPFQAGLKHYLTTHAYKNTDTIDLWRALEEISGKPVMEFMHAWTSTSGFPLVTAYLIDNKLKLSQERFYSNPLAKKQSQLWPIDLGLHETKDSTPIMLNDTELEIEVSNPDRLLINKGSAGFYRVSYNSSHLQKIGSQITKGHVPADDRLGVLADLIETAKSGKSSTADALEFISNFRNETNYAVWDVIASSLGSIRLVMNDEELREAIKPFTRKLVANEIDRLGWSNQSNESHFDQLLRPIVLGMAASADTPEIVEHAKKLFEKAHSVEDINPDLRSGASSSELKRGTVIDPDLKSVVFGTVARLGDEDTFDKLLSLYEKAHLSDEKVTIAGALTGFKQSELIDRALGMIKTDAVRLQDVSYWVAYSFMNRHARDETWDWVKQNWDWLDESLGSDLSFYRMPIYAARVMSDESFIKEYKDFFEPKLSPSFERSYRQGLEMLQFQCAWKKRDFDEVLNFFKHQK